jgi:hypothetical protein
MEQGETEDALAAAYSAYNADVFAGVSNEGDIL